MAPGVSWTENKHRQMVPGWADQKPGVRMSTTGYKVSSMNNINRRWRLSQRKKKKAEAKIQFYCALLRFVDLSQSMIPKFENLMVIPIIPSTCQSFLSFKKLYIQLYIPCFHHWLLKGSFLLEKGCSWLSERIFSRKNLSAVSRNAAFSSQVYFIHA